MPHSVARTSRPRLLPALLLLALGPALAAWPQTTFAWITDTHIGSGVGNQGAQLLQQRLGALPGQPSFWLVTGDCTEFGLASDFEAYRAFTGALGAPVYSLPGNHDTTWAPKARMAQMIGPLHCSVDCGPAHLIGLDATTEMRGEGSFSQAERRFLAGELARIPAAKPLILAFHPPLDDGRGLDEEPEILRVIRDRPVVLVVVGHGHSDRQSRLNNAVCLMSNDAYTEGKATVNLVEVTATEIAVRKWRIATGALEEACRVPLDRPDGRAEIVRPPAEAVTGSPPTVQARVTAGQPVAAAEAALGRGDWMPMAAVEGGFELPGEAFGNDWTPGRNEITVVVKLQDGAQLVDGVVVDIRPPDRDRLVWRQPVGGEVLGRTHVAGDAVLVGSYGGQCRALAAATGGERWATRVGGPVRGEPAVVGDLAVFGCTDGRVYALRVADGTSQWAVEAGAPIVAGVAAAEGRAYVGTSGGRLLCLDGATGRELWQHESGAVLDAQPTVDKGVVYYSDWENHALALDAADGRPLWEQKIGANRYYSPAAASPVVLGETVLFASPDQSLYRLDRHTGQVLAATKVPAWASIGGGPGAVYVRDLDSNLVAYGEDGAELWRVLAGWGWDHAAIPPFAARAAAGSEALVFAPSKHGRMNAFAPADGALRWAYRFTAGLCLAGAVADAERVYCGATDGSVVALKR